MAKYEYVLRQPDRPDEQLITDVDSAEIGDEVVIRNRRWIVVAIEPCPDPSVTERKILAPAE